VKKLLLLSLVCCLTAALASPAAALRWPDNMSYRVDTMGGATLGIEDETTAVTVFNHENVAGVVLNKKENRFDIGAGMMSTSDKVDVTGGSVETTSSTLFLARPGAEYRGLTYWLDDSFAIRAGIEGQMINLNAKTPAGENKLSFTGLGGGASASYKLADAGLAFGAGVSYIGGSGKPDPLPAGTDKYEIAASNLSWGVGAAWETLMGEDKLSIGAGVHADDDMPSMSLSGMSPGDYNITTTMEATGFTQKTTDTQSPMVISAEAIYNMGKMLEAGLLFDYKMSEMKEKVETTIGGTSSTVEQKVFSLTEMGISPIVRATIPLSEDMSLLPGISFTNWGSGTQDMYADNPTTADLNDTFKAQSYTGTSSLIKIGAGLQAMAKQLALSLQYETGSDKVDVKQFDVDGNELGSGTSEGSTSNMRVGAEYWVIPMLAIRAGFASLLHTTKDGAMDSGGNLVDLKDMTNRISFGAGLEMPEGLRIDLLVGLDTNTTDPKADPEPTSTATDILLGFKIPI
jgi:hypothetical protein